MNCGSEKLQGKCLALIMLCKAYTIISYDAFPVLADVLPVDLGEQRRIVILLNAGKLNSSL